MNLRGFFLVIFTLISTILFLNFNSPITVKFSFLLNLILLSFIIIYHLFYEKDNSPFISSFIVFNFLFFTVAPIVQITSFNKRDAPKFVNNYPFEEFTVLYANLLIFIFNFIFIVSYIILKTKQQQSSSIYKFNSEKYSAIIIFFILFFCFLLAVSSYNFVIEDLARPSWMEYKENVSKLLIWKKVLFMIPFGGILLCYDYLKKKSLKNVNTNSIVVFSSLIFFILLLFWFKNPFTEKRNALGPIYICFLLLFLPKIFSNNVKSLSFLFFIMIVLFPLSSILTHTDATFSEVINNPMILINEAKYGGIAKTFNTLHYDAFANINATINFVSKNGFSLGVQLLSVFLFFVPRSVWLNKPISTGQLVGEHLIDNYNFNFSNLSNPLVSEGYINFGIFGVIIFAVLLAFVLVKMLSWFKSSNLSKKIMAFYFAIHLLFLLRGDLTNGYSYYIGTLIGVVFIPKIISIFIREIFKINRNVS